MPEIASSKFFMRKRKESWFADMACRLGSASEEVAEQTTELRGSNQGHVSSAGAGSRGQWGQEHQGPSGSGQRRVGTRKAEEMTARQAGVKAPFSQNRHCANLTLERIGVGVVEDKWLRGRAAKQF